MLDRMLDRLYRLWNTHFPERIKNAKVFLYRARSSLSPVKIEVSATSYQIFSMENGEITETWVCYVEYLCIFSNGGRLLYQERVEPTAFRNEKPLIAASMTEEFKDNPLISVECGKCTESHPIILPRTMFQYLVPHS